MQKINIALSASFSDGNLSIREEYIHSIWACGGIPSVVQPRLDEKYIEDTVSTFDGFVFCGGGDIDPKFYGEEKCEAVSNICPARDEFEYRLFIALLQSRKPILGICRGMQILNVFLGGSLYQHISGHMQKEERHILTHNIDIPNGSFLADITGENRIDVNSFHHQAIKKLANGLIIDSVSADGYIEAYHLAEHDFFLGVQWHPEALFDLNDSSKHIFEAFIDACKHQKEQQ